MHKKMLGMLLAGALMGSLLAGCGDGAQTGGDAYIIAANTWGAGAYPLDDIVRNDQYLCDQLGLTLDVANNEFTADKVVSQLENQLANNPNAVLFS